MVRHRGGTASSLGPRRLRSDGLRRAVRRRRRRRTRCRGRWTARPLTDGFAVVLTEWRCSTARAAAAAGLRVSVRRPVQESEMACAAAMVSCGRRRGSLIGAEARCGTGFGQARGFRQSGSYAGSSAWRRPTTGRFGQRCSLGMPLGLGRQMPCATAMRQRGSCWDQRRRGGPLGPAMAQNRLHGWRSSPGDQLGGDAEELLQAAAMAQHGMEG
jgi:hypothetical protein